MLNNLRSANDIILFSESEEKPKDLHEDMNEKGKKTNIRFNEIARRRQRKANVVKHSVIVRKVKPFLLS